MQANVPHGRSMNLEKKKSVWKESETESDPVSFFGFQRTYRYNSSEPMAAGEK